ncbi:MAG: hypothetical protein WBJ10_06035 [Daejeonella sp.]|uniref:hypothetical protein n=1 Tax=Daejeonella sp. TaxID=2805397 RepID=UPI003C754B79
MIKEPLVAKPTIHQATIYFIQKGFEAIDAEQFFREYSNRNWKGSKGIPVKNWRAKALDWMWQRQRICPYLRTKAKLFI